MQTIVSDLVAKKLPHLEQMISKTTYDFDIFSSASSRREIINSAIAFRQDLIQLNKERTVGDKYNIQDVLYR